MREGRKVANKGCAAHCSGLLGLILMGRLENAQSTSQSGVDLQVLSVLRRLFQGFLPGTSRLPSGRGCRRCSGSPSPGAPELRVPRGLGEGPTLSAPWCNVLPAQVYPCLALSVFGKRHYFTFSIE